MVVSGGILHGRTAFSGEDGVERLHDQRLLAIALDPWQSAERPGAMKPTGFSG
jgi:hypothetical protein